MSECVHCRDECGKRNILCKECWNELPQVRKTAIRMAPYRRDEIGKKFVTDLLTCEEEVLRQMIADGAVKMEKYADKTGDKRMREIIVTEMNKAKEAMEIV